MAGISIDHIVSLIVFLAAILLFIGLFSQTAQTAIIYQQNQGVATKCSDVLDNMLLNPGSPTDWGQSDISPASFGVQDPEFTEYQLSAFSLMRLGDSTGNTVEYAKTTNQYYTNMTSEPGLALLTPNALALNYTTALQLLGLNGTYGFQLSLTPDVTVQVSETHSCSPLNLTVTATGSSFPFSDANVNYCLLLVTLGQTAAQYPSYTIMDGSALTNAQGVVSLSFPTVTNPNQVYSFIAYAHLDGVEGIGYHINVSAADPAIVPLVDDMATDKIALANSNDLNNLDAAAVTLKYNVTFVFTTQAYSLSELSIGSSSSPGLVGTVTSGVGNPYPTVVLPSCTTGILIVAYQESASQGGVVMMPWGINALALPINFGGNPQQQAWSATDIRQVTIGDVTYQAKLSLWSDQTMQVTN